MDAASERSGPSRARKFAAGVLPRLAFYPFLAGSLLVFPAALPWMILAWLGLAGVRGWKGRPAWPVLLLGLGVILVKRVDWPGELIVLCLGILAAAADDFLHRRPAARPRPAWRAGMGIALAVAWAAFTFAWNSAIHVRPPVLVRGNRPIVCVGDSLTSAGFPRLLGLRTRVPVLDFSRGGITLTQARSFFPQALATGPQAVVLELGGHDFLAGRSRRETRDLLRQMVLDARAAGAEVFLFEVPRGFITDPYGGLERGLARELGLELIPDGAIRNLVIFSPFSPLARCTGRLLSYDGLHPNEEGNRFLAERVLAALRHAYGDAILR